MPCNMQDTLMLRKYPSLAKFKLNCVSLFHWAILHGRHALDLLSIQIAFSQIVPGTEASSSCMHAIPSRLVMIIVERMSKVTASFVSSHTLFDEISHPI